MQAHFPGSANASRPIPCYSISGAAFASQDPHGQTSTRGRKRPRMAATTAVAPAATAPTARNAHMPQQPMLEYSNLHTETAANSRSWIASTSNTSNAANPAGLPFDPGG